MRKHAGMSVDRCFVAVLLSLTLLLGPSPASAQPAKVFVNSAVLAIGDRPVLLDLKSQRIVSHGENFEPDQSLRPGAEPRKVSSFRCVLLRDLENGRLRYEWEREIEYPSVKRGDTLR